VRLIHIYIIAGMLQLMLAGNASAEAISVELVKKDDGGWQLLRDGKPYFINGAGGSGSKDLLAKSGANTFRTWGIGEGTQSKLDEAQKFGLTVVLGHWLGHERHGFDYGDQKQLDEQFEKAKTHVMKYKDHPALLMWAVGNEMEGFKDGDDLRIWKHVQKIAAMIKELDPHHPVMTVTAEIGGERVKMVHEQTPDIDIMGINSYGGLPSVPDRYKKAGGTKPYIVTEFGPPGTWEIGMTSYGAPPELNSTEKAAVYVDHYTKGCLNNPKLCLGGFAFTWGSKIEATSTWFGMFLPNGDKLASVDAMTEIWSGKPAENRSPEVRWFDIKGSDVVKPGEVIEVELDIVDPEGEDVDVNWIVTGEVAVYNSGGDVQAAPLPLDDVLSETSNKGVKMKIPSGGIYRLYMTASDGSGGGATASVPFKVDGPVAPVRIKMPLKVYADGAPETWAASGWMGDYKYLEMNPKSTDAAYSGETGLKFTYTNLGGWVGVTWQHPANDWGDKPGGFDLTGATKLTFWARSKGKSGLIDFGVGILGDNKKYHDSLKVESKGHKLTREWKKFTIDLEDQDLTRVKTPFYWVIGGKGRQFTFYIDDIQFE